MTDYTVDGKHVKAVQYDGEWTTLSDAFPSLNLNVDGANRTFFEKDGERHYVEKGDYVTLAGPKYSVVDKSDFNPDKETKSAAKAPAKTADKAPTGPSETSPETETVMRPAQGSATTDDRK